MPGSGAPWSYIAELEVHHARIFDCCEPKNGDAPFARLAEQVAALQYKRSLHYIDVTGRRISSQYIAHRTTSRSIRHGRAKWRGRTTAAVRTHLCSTDLRSSGTLLRGSETGHRETIRRSTASMRASATISTNYYGR